ncbi:subunit length determinant protein [Anseongella ginsenosidimutans]|uniref:Subunit length determinant protein n=1 Tax=Anseongella ginsenosidimutans TaxID=496056 RepID=A0A4R3KM78_9SPHI|nr:Wzz/FepE/Etk N-terminal domain-containing protein [Anseongella ginsenosidimutans]QEC52114.1 hypothetical protein FRZ59_07055 [Anseongella ginsenosidimutans]TCS84857.1 subunit length determinant protein [Anseongella ginsenosidimutans]
MQQTSFREIYDTLFRRWKTILVSVIIALMIGLFAYLITPKEYSGEALLAVEGTADNKKGGLGALANLAGINITEQNGLNALVYEDIIYSTPYLIEVGQHKVMYKGDSVYLKDYLAQAMIVSLQQKISSLFGGKPSVVSSNDTVSYKITEEDPGQFRYLKTFHVDGLTRRAVNILRNRIDFSLSEKSPVINVSVKLQDPDVSAEAARIVIKELSDYISDYEYDKQHHNIAYLEEQVQKAKEEAYQAQAALARAKDRNRNVISAIPSVELQKLAVESQISQNVYNSLALRLEEARIGIEEEKSTFMVIEPPIPMNVNSPVAPRFVIYCIFSVVLGVVAAISIIFISTFLQRNL